jgi:hypothetical protein
MGVLAPRTKNESKNQFLKMKMLHSAYLAMNNADKC